VNLIGLAVSVFAIELLFGDWRSAYLPPLAAVVDRSYVYRQDLYAPFGDIVYKRDKYGLRGVREPLSRIALVTVGGSTTDQRYIGEGETWQDVLRMRTGIAVANAGVDGMTSFGYLIAVTEWLHRLPNFSPAHYLHYIGINDASMSGGQTESDRSGASSPWLLTIRKRSAIGRAVTKLWISISAPREVNHGAVRVPPGGLPPVMIKVEIAARDIEDYIETTYKPNLRKLLALHHGRGEEAIFVSQSANPAIIAWKGPDTYVSAKFPELQHWALALRLINGATEAVCRQDAACRFVDLAGELRFDAGDFYDLVHMTPSGARKIGAFLADQLAHIRNAP
jgi:hypothetical protein